MSTKVVAEYAKSGRSSSKKCGRAITAMWTAFLTELSPWRQSRALPISRLNAEPEYLKKLLDVPNTPPGSVSSVVGMGGDQLVGNLP
ncbi:hypothetical protein SLEP1_g39194 [Rubroshorea leprosula]|uniref:PARP-type domain-containing protein n=1 Tax=Rubroshorea leprosula TaxID=152421 RepID=A0AAV5KZF1_9ROSI|nr:hypothetical protein SLEP1_g39194 [Rubroshorea leprosula]